MSADMSTRSAARHAWPPRQTRSIIQVTEVAKPGAALKLMRKPVVVPIRRTVSATPLPPSRSYASAAARALYARALRRAGDARVLAFAGGWSRYALGALAAARAFFHAAGSSAGTSRLRTSPSRASFGRTSARYATGSTPARMQLAMIE